MPRTKIDEVFYENGGGGVVLWGSRDICCILMQQIPSRLRCGSFFSSPFFLQLYFSNNYTFLYGSACSSVGLLYFSLYPTKCELLISIIPWNDESTWAGWRKTPILLSRRPIFNLSLLAF